MDQCNSGSISTRGSLGSSQHPHFNFTQNNHQNTEFFGKSKKDQMNIIQEILEDE